MAIRGRTNKRWWADSLARHLREGAVCAFGMICLIGCSSSAPTTQPSTITDRQNQALRDPYSYNPDFTKPDHTVSGENDPDGLKRDLHDVLNP